MLCHLYQVVNPEFVCISEQCQLEEAKEAAGGSAAYLQEASTQPYIPLTDDGKCQCWTKNGNTLYHNEDSTSISICTATHNYCNEDYAHCLTNNYCSNLNGLRQNLDDCLCTLPSNPSPFVTVPGRRIESPNKTYVSTSNTCQSL